MALTESRYAPAAITGWWKGAAFVVAAGVVAYSVLLVHLMALTLLSMHADIADMRGQLHRTASALSVTNAKLEVVNTHLVATNQELLQTNQKLVQTNKTLLQTNGKLSDTAAGVLAMKSDTAGMLGDLRQMTHRIVHAKLLF